MSFEKSLFASMANPELAEKLYDNYCRNSKNVGEKWRSFFNEIDSSSEELLARSKKFDEKLFCSEKESVLKEEAEREEEIKDASHKDKLSREEYISGDPRLHDLIRAYRSFGHFSAHTNPIYPAAPSLFLKPENFGFSKRDLLQYFSTEGILEKKCAPLQDIVSRLEEIYCSNIGFDYMNLANPKLEKWFQNHIESMERKASLSIEDKQMILQHLNKSELFESFLHKKYAGQKRFSLEGSETLIPIIMAVIENGSNHGIEEFVIGMAHRGRLNVLSNILNKSYVDIFSEFEESYIPNSFEGSGDLKYHKGFSSEIVSSKGNKVKISLADNPSHLESVDPVVEGIVHAKQILKDDPLKEKVLAILIHGDAAISGQGVVYESMQLSKLEGYSTGGTIHLIINNQVGFTTSPKDTKSTKYCMDISKAFSSPALHVNAEDPEGCVYAVNLAIEARQIFHCDVFICMNSYRRYSHNGIDEPAFTQPLEYKLIRKKKPIRELYRDHIIKQGVLEKYMAEVLEEEFKSSLQNALKGAKGFETERKKEPKENNVVGLADIFKKIETGTPKKTLQKLGERLCNIPKGFHAHKQISSLMNARLEILKFPPKEKAIDWRMAEHLAFATLLKDEVHIRLSGQDSRRGTFGQRHAMWVDQENDAKYFPLKHITKKQGRFDVFNSPLSEFAVLGFEFGYSLTFPKSLVIWEAQFGDFSNGAQIIIDQFITTAEQKWGVRSHLLLFLPHGYEGQGPEHSSARIGRFLQLCGENNIFITVPTTPAQFFHLLRRQAMKEIHKPLIVFTPKGLLRHPECVSGLDEFTEGTFLEVMDDLEPPEEVERLLFCSGRIYYDIVEERRRRKNTNTAVIRIEQLYPLHETLVKKTIEKYKGIKECFWVQEEPHNMGAWDFIHSSLQNLLPKNVRLKYVGRKRSAAPAAGSFALHKKEHVMLMNEVFAKGEQHLYQMTRDSVNA